jgi:hypothetical protein
MALSLLMAVAVNAFTSARLGLTLLASSPQLPEPTESMQEQDYA